MTDNSPKIGKDVIESLTLGMYDNALCIYREYIQNAADAIDKAIKEGVLQQGEDEIHITIDSTKGSILIEDNGIGIPQAQVVTILRNIAHSTKERGVDKGFRGIGRLGGLGYCAKLTFETSYKEEDSCSILTWDAEKLKTIINDRLNSEEATEVLDRITKYTSKKEEVSKHYFKVLLEGVVKEELLKVEKVREYLSMVAPIDIPTKFIYRKKIYDFMQEHNLKVDIYNLYVNKDQLYKPYANQIYEDNNGSKKAIDDILDVDFLLAKDNNDTILYWGWYTLSHLKGQMPTKNIARGIRLRKENIQIGDEDTLASKGFTKKDERRFSTYYFGEIYAVNNNLIPNSRRDYFGENEWVTTFEQHLKEDFSVLKKMCYDGVDVRKLQELITKRQEKEKELQDKQQGKGFTSTNEQTKLQQQLQELCSQESKLTTKVKNTIKNIDISSPRMKIFSQVTKSTPTTPTPKISTTKTKPILRTETPLYTNKFDKKERKVIGKIYEALSIAFPDEQARKIIDIIEKEITK